MEISIPLKNIPISSLSGFFTHSHTPKSVIDMVKTAA
nr:MAG TPA: hypothetical protein [Caudoviricetes sp.]